MKLTRQQFLTRSGIQGQTLELWLEQSWLLPEDTPAGPMFSDIDTARAAFIRDLQRDFGANDDSVGVILHLVDQLHGMRLALSLLRQHKQDDGPAPSASTERDH